MDNEDGVTLLRDALAAAEKTADALRQAQHGNVLTSFAVSPLAARALALVDDLAGLTTAAADALWLDHDSRILQMGENASQRDRDLCVQRLKRGWLPLGFSQWQLHASEPSADGWTLLHMAALYGRWPAGMSDADLLAWKDAEGGSPLLWRTADGTTVAHVAAQGGYLPLGFDQWDARDDFGESVAHTAAKFNTLPPDFDRWDLIDPNDHFRNVGIRDDIMAKAVAWHKANQTRPSASSPAG
jgi:hypothetical protein